MLFNGWPDGQPLDEQEQIMLDVFAILKDEDVSILNQKKQE